MTTQDAGPQRELDELVRELQRRLDALDWSLGYESAYKGLDALFQQAIAALRRLQAAQREPQAQRDAISDGKTLKCSCGKEWAVPRRDDHPTDLEHPRPRETAAESLSVDTSVAERDAVAGTTSCPICNTDKPHEHDARTVVAWRAVTKRHGKPFAAYEARLRLWLVYGSDAAEALGIGPTVEAAWLSAHNVGDNELARPRAGAPPPEGVEIEQARAWLQASLDWHEAQEAMADAMGFNSSADYHKAHAGGMRAMLAAAPTLTPEQPDSMGHPRPRETAAESLSVDTSGADRKDAARGRYLIRALWCDDFLNHFGCYTNSIATREKLIDAAMSADVRSQEEERP